LVNHAVQPRSSPKLENGLQAVGAMADGCHVLSLEQREDLQVFA